MFRLDNIVRHSMFPYGCKYSNMHTPENTVAIPNTETTKYNVYKYIYIHIFIYLFIYLLMYVYVCMRSWEAQGLIHMLPIKQDPQTLLTSSRN